MACVLVAGEKRSSQVAGYWDDWFLPLVLVDLAAALTCCQVAVCLVLNAVVLHLLSLNNTL
jgi:hypothetical protein